MKSTPIAIATLRVAPPVFAATLAQARPASDDRVRWTREHAAQNV